MSSYRSKHNISVNLPSSRVLSSSGNHALQSQRIIRDISAKQRKLNQKLKIKSSRITNQKIQILAKQLYPRINNIYNSIQLKKLDLLSQQKYDVNDSDAANRKMQNRILMNNAQRELDKRIKNRIVEKSKKLTYGGGQSYQLIYRRFKTQYDKKQKNGQFDQQLQSNQPIQTVPPQIKYYTQLKSHPTIVNYTKSRIQQKKRKKQRQMDGKIGDSYSQPVLKTLNKRKRKKTQFQIQEPNYDDQLANIGQISDRLKKIYSRDKKIRMNKQQIDYIKKCNIISQQHLILQDLHEHPQRISIGNKQKLINKFNQILNQFGRSSTDRRRQLKLFKNKDMRSIFLSSMTKRNQVRSIFRALKKEQNTQTSKISSQNTLNMKNSSTIQQITSDNTKKQIFITI